VALKGKIHDYVETKKIMKFFRKPVNVIQMVETDRKRINENIKKLVRQKLAFLNILNCW
jgi:hypothetical protein